MATISPNDVNKLTKPTSGFLCPLNANTYGIDFLNFTIADYETKKTIFEVGRDNPNSQDVSVDFSSPGEDMYRKIKYNFSEDVLRLPYVQTTLVFGVGERDVHDFRMIERHYFRDQLVKSFDFDFGFCIPGSVNTWDAVYSMPPLSETLINDMIDNPFETRSDSFYFVGGKLVMHNKAAYKYIREDKAQAKKSYEDRYGAKGGSKGQQKASEKQSSSSAVPEISTASGAADSKEVSPRSRASSTTAAKASAKEHAWSKEDDYF